MFYKAFILLITFFIITKNFGQTIIPDNRSTIRSLTVNDGLPQGQVRGMVQDKQGFIWIASEGLSRYDGRGFINYTHIVGDAATIAYNDIRDLLADVRMIWGLYMPLKR